MLRKLVRRSHGVVMMTHHNYQCTIAAATPHHHNPFSFTPSVIIRPQQHHHHPRSVSMTSEGDHNLEAIFSEKRILRSKVKKDLRSMDPALRSHEGMFCF